MIGLTATPSGTLPTGKVGMTAQPEIRRMASLNSFASRRTASRTWGHGGVLRCHRPRGMVNGALAWEEIAGLVGRALGEPVRGGAPLTPGWSSRTTWAAHGERTGPLVVKARRGDRAHEKTAWCADRLPLLAARGYPVPTIIWHGPARDQWHLAVQSRLPGRPAARLDGRLLAEVLRAGRAAGRRRRSRPTTATSPATSRTCCSTTGTRCGPTPAGPAGRPASCARGSGAGWRRCGGCGCRRPTSPTTT